MQSFIWIPAALAAVCFAIAIVQRVYRRGLAKDATSWLGVLREGHPNPELVLSHFREKLGRSKYSLEKVGTSEEEICALTKRGHALAIIYELDRLRKNPAGANAVVGIIRKSAIEWNLTLGEIGTDENEFKELALRARRMQALSLVEELRRIAQQRQGAFKAMLALRQQIEGNKEFTYAELGTSEGELNQLAPIS